MGAAVIPDLSNEEEMARTGRLYLLRKARRDVAKKLHGKLMHLN